MKIILLKDVAKVGKKYEVKEISDGYAVNLIIPRGLGISATPEAVKRIEKERGKEDGLKKIQEELFLKNLADLENVTLTIKGRASQKGHLFAGLHKEDIAKELETQTRLIVNPEFIQLEHPIKEVGEQSIEVKGAGKSLKFKVIVEAGNK